MLLYAKQPRGKGRWVALCAGAGGEAWTPCSLNKHKDHCGPTGKDKEEDLIFSRRFSHVDSKLMLQLKYLEPNSALSHARFSWFIPKPKQCNRDQNLAPAFLNCCYPITNFHLCPWVTNGIFILFFFKLRTWFWTRNELCVQGCQSGRVDTRAERQSWRHKAGASSARGSWLCAWRREQQAVLCEEHTKTCLGKEKWDHLALG